MNREIKFRRWVNITNPMTNAKGFFITADNSLPIAHYIEDKILTLSIDPNVIYQQYTGLKDINDKEIYEGDIVELHYANQSVGFGLYEIFWDRDFKLKEYKRNWMTQNLFPSNLSNFNICKVIGNIFENPKLLEK